VASHAAGKDGDEVERALAGMTGWLEGGDTLPDWPGVAALAPARARKARHGAILLPFRALLMVPNEVLLGQRSALSGLALQLFWVVVMTVIARAMLRAGERKVVIQGG